MQTVKGQLVFFKTVEGPGDGVSVARGRLLNRPINMDFQATPPNCPLPFLHLQHTFGTPYLWGSLACDAHALPG